MFGNYVEDEFANNITGAKTAADGGGTWGLLVAIALGLSAFLLWAVTFELEENARATGRVIPSQQVQVVQSLEGGIVRTIDVREGDIVEAGDVLMQIDDTRFASARGELLEREEAILAESVRLQAEAQFLDDLHFTDELWNRNSLAIQAETQVFQSRRNQLTRELEVLQDQLFQRQGKLNEMLALREKTQAVLAPLTIEIELTEGLVERGIVPNVELLRLKSRHAELTGDIAVSVASEPRLKASIREQENQISAARSAYVLTARERLAKLQLELAVVQESLRAATDRVTRAQLRAPVRGIVNTISATTIGAVVQPGAPLAEIVPVDDSLLIEANLGPRDIAFVKPGEKASVKISAYDYLVYGSLDGIVVRIGADTIETPDGSEYFQIIVRTDRSYLGTEENPLPITPGMIATVDIQTGQKTVLSYLAKPLLRARSEALRER